MSRRASKSRYIVSVVQVTDSVPRLSNAEEPTKIHQTTEKIEIYSQNVKALDLAELIKAVNK